MSTIFHIDVNSAFLSWSALKRLRVDPESVDLRTIPSAVGGDIQTRHGVITAKSIPAKKYGVQTGEPVVRALEKCPQLVLVKSDFQTYRAYSARFMEILKEYTPLIQKASIDEAYVDVSSLVRSRSDALALARQISGSIKGRLGFTVNIGISENKFLAKMASDFEKPDKIHTLYPEEINAKMWPLGIRDLYGCGPATTEKLHRLGFVTIGELAACDPQLLIHALGKSQGTYIHRRANGIDASPVETTAPDAKSYSNETTTAQDIDQKNYLQLAVPIIKELGAKVAARLQRDGYYAATVFVQVKTGTFQRHSRQTKLRQSTNQETVIMQTALRLMAELTRDLFDQGEVLRLIGLGVTGLSREQYRQMGMEDWLKVNEESLQQKEKNRRLEEMTRKIQNRYGKEALRRGSQ